jgi:predicted DNA-binding protein with PD1-like motif
MIAPGLLSVDAMQLLPVRLAPGQELRAVLDTILEKYGVSAAFVLQGIGSLSRATIRLAGASAASELCGDFEILTLAGSLSPDGSHLHISVADAQGRVTGGHVSPGCTVRTTAEILIALLPAFAFSREFDAGSGYRELSIRDK